MSRPRFPSRALAVLAAPEDDDYPVEIRSRVDFDRLLEMYDARKQLAAYVFMHKNRLCMFLDNPERPTEVAAFAYFHRVIRRCGGTSLLPDDAP